MRTAQTAQAADQAAWAAGPAGRAGAAPDALAALAAAADAQWAQLAELLAPPPAAGWPTAPGSRSPTPSPAPCAPSSTPGLRRALRHTGLPPPAGDLHPLPGRPARAARTRPLTGTGAELDRHARARDRRCRFPRCRRPVPIAGELDHHRSHAAGGQTAAANLAGYCTGDHRGRHQAPGRRHQLDPDGTLTVTTPTGLTAVTTPPPY